MHSKEVFNPEIYCSSSEEGRTGDGTETLQCEKCGEAKSSDCYKNMDGPQVISSAHLKITLGVSTSCVRGGKLLLSYLHIPRM